MSEIDTNTNNRTLLFSLLAFALGTYFYMQHRTPSLDLLALWLGGHFYSIGDFAQIYAPDMGVFTMHPPAEWVEYMRVEFGFTGPIYPYIYPPIWAWLAAPVAANVGFLIVSKLALLVNVLALTGAMGLTYRLSETRMHPTLYVILAGAILLLTPIGYLALGQAQVQILVSFLILLSLERTRFNHPVMAGIALALAASLKLYPALFALFWLATGERRAACSFALTGAAMGVLSILLTGWPLHADFLHQIATISNTVFTTGVTVNFDAVLALVGYTDAMQTVPASGDAQIGLPQDGWLVMVRPLWWKVLSNLALLSVMSGLWLGFRKVGREAQFTLMWPLALTIIPLVAPIAWIYYYIPTALFAATLPGRLGLKMGLALALLGMAPMLAIMIPVYREIALFHWMMPIMAVLGLMVWILGFVLAQRQNV